MPKISTGLTVKKIEAAKPGATHSDGFGLMLVVDARANKRWIFRYTRPDGRRNAIGMGSWPIVSLYEARKKAFAAREEVSKDHDPGEMKKLEKASLRIKDRSLFMQVANDWHASKEASWEGETNRKARQVLDNHLIPELGKIRISDLSTSQIKPVLLGVHNCAPSLATKARQYLNQIVEYAIQENLREDGKFLSLKNTLPRTKKSHYPAVTNLTNLTKLLNGLHEIDSLVTRVAIWTCLYTASRPSMAAGMRWDEINEALLEWHIPESRMKMEYGHVSPIPTQLLAMLNEVKSFSARSEYVFPNLANPNKHIHRDSLSKALRENNLRGLTVTHGLRATFRTIARERLTSNEDVLEAQLAHAKAGEVQAAYDRTQLLDERKVLVQRWADYLDATLSSDYKVAR